VLVLAELLHVWASAVSVRAEASRVLASTCTQCKRSRHLLRQGIWLQGNTGTSTERRMWPPSFSTFFSLRWSGVRPRFHSKR
jgi:hypothetical protein